MTQSGPCFCFDKSMLAKSIRVEVAKKKKNQDDKWQMHCSAERQNKVALTLKNWVQRFQSAHRKCSNSINCAPSIIPANFQPSTWLYLIARCSISRSKVPTKKKRFVIKSRAQGFDHLSDQWRLVGVEMRLSDGQNLVGSPELLESWFFVGFWFWMYLGTHSDCFHHRYNKLTTKKEKDIELQTRPVKHYKFISGSQRYLQGNILVMMNIHWALGTPWTKGGENPAFRASHFAFLRCFFF